jgi:hypothetical protein
MALTEAASREGNERMHEWVERQDAPATKRFLYLCECGHEGCQGRLGLTRSEYEAIRANELRFAVLVGHESPEIERVLDTRDGYLVVEKNEEVRALVERDYPPRERKVS